MIYRIEQENLLINAVYHAACLTTYLAYIPKSTDTSTYNLVFERVVKIINRDHIRNKKSHFMSFILTIYQTLLKD